MVGPMGVGKSTELAAAQQSLIDDRFAFRIGIDLTFDMRRIQAGEVFAHILAKFVAARPNPDIDLKLRTAEDLVVAEKREFRRDLARKALRAVGNVTLIVDGLEKAEPEAARAVAEELFALGDDADIVLVVPTSLAYGPGAAILGEDVRLFPVPPVFVWSSPAEDSARGRLFLREVALRHLNMEKPSLDVLAVVDRACVVSGGIPRVVLQLLRDARRHAAVARRAVPDLRDLEQAEHDHGEQLRRSLLAGDRSALLDAEGRDGSELQLDRKLRFLLQGHLLEYQLSDHVVTHIAPTLARALRIPQDLA